MLGALGVGQVTLRAYAQLVQLGKLLRGEHLCLWEQSCTAEEAPQHDNGLNETVHAAQALCC